MLLFVYGTLKRNGSNSDFLSGQKFIGEAKTKPMFRLFELCGYPGMVTDPNTGLSVSGELWDVDDECLERLDVLEDIPGGEYAREVIPLEPPFDRLVVEGYRYLRRVDGRPDLGGSW